MALSLSSRLRLFPAYISTTVTQWFGELLGHRDISAEEALAHVPGIDPRMIPKAAMSAADIDVHLLNELGKIGLKRGKLMTEASHPEIMSCWEQLSKRAGLPHTPQLILTESDRINALTVSPEEMVVTTGLLKILNVRELNAVLGHELGHGTSHHETPRMVAKGVFGGGGLIAGNLLAHRGGIGGILQKNLTKETWLKKAVTWKYGTEVKPLSVLGSLATMAVGASIGNIIANQVSVRPTELDADRKGAIISGDPEALASALRKLNAHRGRNPLLNLWSRIESGYPSSEERIARLEAMAKTMQPAAHTVISQTAEPIAAQPKPQVTAVTQNTRVEQAVGQNAAIG